MKPIIKMCNYYGMCDKEGDPIGHTIKVTNEYAGLLKERYAIHLLASPCIVRKCNRVYFEQVKALEYNICVSFNSILKRIVDKFKLLININQVFGDEGVLFFYQVDFFFFLYILLFYRKQRETKIICLIYHQDFTGGKISIILQSIYNRALKKIDGVIYTQQGKAVNHKQTVWIPDYFYSEKQYASYQRITKKDRVVCVGTMNQYKQLETLVMAFAGKEIKLVIAGQFDDTERYNALLKIKTDNIEIHNKKLSYEEYMEFLATSKYSILPYDMKQYVNRTSGVLLESIYVGSIPIAPRVLLTQNNLPGIGYEEFRDLFKNGRIIQSETIFDFKSIYEQNNASNFCDFIGRIMNDG